MRLKQNCFKTVPKLVWNCFVSVSFRFFKPSGERGKRQRRTGSITERVITTWTDHRVDRLPDRYYCLRATIGKSVCPVQ